MNVVSDTAISATEALGALQDLDEMTDSQRRTLEHLTRHLSVQDMETFAELEQELEEMDLFRPEHIIKIIETLPTTEQEVRTLFQKERIKMDDDDIEQVIAFAESVQA